MSDCIFCRIVKGELPSKKEYDDGEFMVIHDINPSAPIHLLVIPHRHIETLMDMSPDDLPIVARLHAVIQKIAADRGIAQPGFRVLHNVNDWGGQKVFHIHWHILAGKKFA
ncbi:MAG: histidine triad nucleotide-binding protein [Deltaproteobacteria bacterium]|nr:histidine triad nucleotide-binding protein [Deltaproteobacteria bacterium]